MSEDGAQLVRVGGRRLRLTSLDKVLYPATGTTKGDVVDYYAQIAEVMLPHCAGRPATRKRWPDGVGTPEEPGEVFFQKNLGRGTPDWVARVDIEHKDHRNTYPLPDDVATLVWFAQLAALEVHVPQWRVGSDGQPRNPDRLVLDLDPGEGVGLAECAEVAGYARTLLTGMGLDPVPVTSGSKGVHLYAALDGTATSAQVSDVAHELARALEADHPDLVLSKMKRSLRAGKVFVDWSQNNAAKTTVAPYSLRGREHPMVAAPRTWRELGHPRLRQLDYREVLERVARRGDAMAALGEAADIAGGGPVRDRLEVYRARRDAHRTPEPVPTADQDATEEAGALTFVIQEHHARRLHWDFRLAHDGVLVSWALPKGVPATTRKNHLAVQTEDHPMAYGGFAGTIPKGEYGAGEVTIWDHGSYELEKWHEGKEVIATLTGQPDGGLAAGPGRRSRFALIHTGGSDSGQQDHWLIHLMAPPDDDGEDPEDDDAEPSSETPPRSPEAVSPMLATLSEPADLDAEADWAVEMKWDGVRVIVVIEDGVTRLVGRNGRTMSDTYPELADLAEQIDATTAVLDGEIVAMTPEGRPDFGLLQHRIQQTDKRAVARAAADNPVRLMLFDALEIDGTSLLRRSYDDRRTRLAKVVREEGLIAVPPAFEGTLDAAIDASRRWRLEGVVAKRRDSRYTPGRRSRSWRKIKHVQSQEVLVVGWRPGQGSRSGKVGSLLLAVPEEDGLRYVGRVGTGFSEREAGQWVAELERIERKTAPLEVPKPDADDARWVTPNRLAEVEFAEWTSGGRLRQPRWRGWRPDKQP